jgi:hypothetical protein
MPTEPRKHQIDLHGIYPYSILRTDRGPWQERRRHWDDLGLTRDAGRAGREEVETFDPRSLWAREVFQKPGLGTLSTFDPVLAELAYTWYCPPGGRILDPYAGGPPRGLVAGRLGYDYTGIDLSAAQIEADLDAAADWAAAGLLATEPRWYCGDAAETLAELPAAEYDYMFTCPPYFNLERYTDDPRDISNMSWPQFTAAYRETIALAVDRLKPDRFATYVIGDLRDSAGRLRALPELTVAAFVAAGADLYNDQILMNVLGSVPARTPKQWKASRKTGRHHQWVLTFVKGDPKLATAAIGNPDER